MALSSDLISQFVKMTNDNGNGKTDNTVYGTVVEYNDTLYVQIDGSEYLTPVTSTAEIKKGERVTVTVKNHTATVSGNITSPSARIDTVNDVSEKVDTLGSKIEVLNSTIDIQSSDISTLNANIDVFNSSFRIEDDVVTGIKGVDTEWVTVADLEANSASIVDLQADKLSVSDAQLKYATIENVEANYALITDLNAANAEIETLEVTVGDFKTATAENFKAVNANIENLQTDKLSAADAELKYATIETLESDYATIETLKSDYATITNLNAANAEIKTLKNDKLSTSEAEVKYANIDFANIDMAAIKQFFTKSGIISDLVVGDQAVTGKLVGVTITGDLIEGGTVKADKLVIKGTDGLYYKLNTNGETVETEQTEYNSLNGSIITAQSITAEKINVNDLVAFNATIGGFNITDNSIYSGVKQSVDNTTRGIYLDNDGQIAFGDSENYVKYYKDTDGSYKLAISAKSLTFSTGSSSQNLEDAISDIQTEMDTIREEVTTFLYISSANGTVFKNDNISTVLSVIIYRGSDRITDAETLKSLMGDGVYLQWSFKRFNEDTVYTIDSNDSRIGNDGFTFTVSSDDVDAKAIFMCDLID